MPIYAVWIKTHMSGRWIDSLWLTLELAQTRAEQIREAQRAGNCVDNSVIKVYTHELIGASVDQPQEKEAYIE